MSVQQQQHGTGESSNSTGGGDVPDVRALAQAFEALKVELAQMKATADARATLQAPPPQIIIPPNFFAEIAGMNTTNIVPRYSGEKSDSLIRWLKDYTSEARSLGWDDCIKLRRLGAHLEGRAREVFEDAQRAAGADFSLQQAEAALTAAFAKGFWQDAARARLQTRVQRKDETVFAFYRDLCDEAEVAYGDLPPDSRSRTLVSLFVNGLRPNIRSFVFASNPQNENEALQFAVKCENTPFLVEPAWEPAVVASAAARGSDDLHVLRDELSALRIQVSELVNQTSCLGRIVAQIPNGSAVAPQARENRVEAKFTPAFKPSARNRDIVCRSCLKTGHFSRECSAPRVTRNSGRDEGTKTESRSIACVQAPAGNSQGRVLAFEEEEDYPMLGAGSVNWASKGNF